MLELWREQYYRHRGTLLTYPRRPFLKGPDHFHTPQTLNPTALSEVLAIEARLLDQTTWLLILAMPVPRRETVPLYTPKKSAIPAMGTPNLMCNSACAMQTLVDPCATDCHFTDPCLHNPSQRVVVFCKIQGRKPTKERLTSSGV